MVNGLMKTHISYSPNKVIFGLGAASLVGKEVLLMRGSKAMLVTDPGIISAGLIETIAQSLHQENITYVLYDQVEPEPPSKSIDNGAAVLASEGCDLLIGVGGGSALDVTKGVSLLANNSGRILDYVGVDMVPKKGAPMILLPTTAGTGSEVTRVLVMTDEEQNTKNVVFTHFAL
ncbi:MAG: iron-containing alcohol dehydrogenase, partial [Desulfobacterales bacterium]|nr:iron-containing alcohol dehydrogenase [Desulfobacterales bacterium]